MSDHETVVELVEGGKDLKVAYEDRLEYVKKCIQARLSECKIQCEAIKRGFSKIIPQALLNMVNYNELETWICGKAVIDVDLLKRHTKYGGDPKTVMLTENSRCVQWFWEVLREFSEEDKRKFIKFCWAQPRIPPNDEEFVRRSIRFQINPYVKAKGDLPLPEASTCFFNFDLPDYSSKEIMRKKILLAMNTDCDSMNAEINHGEADGHGDLGRGLHHHDHDSYDEDY